MRLIAQDQSIASEFVTTEALFCCQTGETTALSYQCIRRNDMICMVYVR